MARLALVALAALLGCAGCGGGGSDGAATMPTAVAPAKSIVGHYALGGADRRVRTSITPLLITDRRRHDVVPTPRGTRQVQVDLRLDDRGRDRLDPQVISVSAVDDAGTVLSESFRLPPRLLEPADRAHSPRVLSVGFAVPRGRELAQLRIASILDALPVRLRWAL
ncbi:MAG TPA: hypothetical protein VI111_03230 [Thermoleophilaceae bacterium]